MSSIVIERARTLFLFFKYILKNKKQLKRIKSKKHKELKRVYHLNKDYFLIANLVILKYFCVFKCRVISISLNK